MNMFHKVLELWPGHESGTYGRSNRRGHKNARVVFLVHDTSAQLHVCTLFMTHRLIVMYAPVKFHEYIP